MPFLQSLHFVTLWSPLQPRGAVGLLTGLRPCTVALSINPLLFLLNGFRNAECEAGWS